MPGESTQKHCCFCFELTDAAEDGPSVVVRRPGHPSSQELWTHAACLAERLHQRVPFRADIFSE